MTQTLTKTQAFETLKQTLENAGVLGAVAMQYATEFVQDLGQGRVLRFADLGEWRQEGGVIVRRDAAPPQERAEAASHLAQLSASDGALTVEDEASVRELTRNGYSRRAAEEAVHTVNHPLNP